MTTALDGLRVLDISEGLAAPFAAKLLGDLGADVIKLEPPQGGRRPPKGSPLPGRKTRRPRLRFLYANTSKRSVIIDTSNPDDLTLRAHLLQQADVVISHETEPTLAARGLGYEQLSARNPKVILTTVNRLRLGRALRRLAVETFSRLARWAVFVHLCGREHREPLQLGAAVPGKRWPAPTPQSPH